MKLHILSDLHIEGRAFIAPATDADVIILAGDIGKHTHGLEWAVAQPAFAGKPIVYVIGNHEFYDAELIGLRRQLHAKTKELQDAGHLIYLLDDTAVVIDGVRFLGSTLWTDYKLFGNVTDSVFAMQEAKRFMRDHSVIFFAERGSHLDSYARRSSPFLPIHASRIHAKSRAWLKAELAKHFTGKTVVVTHHLPSMKSVASRFSQSLLSAAFASNLDSLVPLADLWVHGHTHDCFDYTVGDCRVICNPRGYRGEDGNGFRPDLVGEV